MIQELCKELGLVFDGKWEDMGGYQFTITNPKLICKGTSMVVFDTDRITLINKMSNIETIWINTELKEVN